MNIAWALCGFLLLLPWIGWGSWEYLHWLNRVTHRWYLLGYNRGVSDAMAGKVRLLYEH